MDTLFNEEIFIVALMLRAEDCKRYFSVFKPQWLRTAELQPILNVIYKFTKEYGIPPDKSTLRKIIQDEDKEVYKLRHKQVLDKLDKIDPSLSEQLYTLKKADEVAVINSFQALINNAQFTQNIVDIKGQQVLSDVNRWLLMFSKKEEEGTLNIKEALEKLVSEAGWMGRTKRIPCGIKCIDDWTSGGLRTKQLGLLLAPTAGGKSACLLNMAVYIAETVGLNVYFITNELSMSEQAERFLARISKPIRKTDSSIDRYWSMNEIQEDPILAYQGLDRKWRQGLHNKLLISSINTDHSCDDLESDIMRFRNINGFKPDVLIIDFMERMKPNDIGYNRDREWIWYGAVAKDLVRLAKRQNLLIWSAIQTNRPGLSLSNVLELSSAQGSIRHLQEASSVIGARKVYIELDEDGEENIECMAFRELKQRHSEMSNREVHLRCDLRRMYISQEEIIPPKLTAVKESDDEDITDKKSIKSPRSIEESKKKK